MAVTGNKVMNPYVTQNIPETQRTFTQQAAGQQGQTAGQQGQTGYKPSNQVTAAQQNLQNIQAQKPQGYTSKFGPQLESIMQQIQNPGKFNYEFNGDNLFKSYADLYTQMGKQASADTMGQAAALTGGYGNSYAQAAANQAYQQYLLPLYDRGLELYDRARQRHQDEIGNQKDVYNMLMNADAMDYGRYRDTVGDWLTEEANAYNRMADERAFDYGAYADALDMDYRNRTLEEQIRQADLDNDYRNRTLQWNMDTDARDYARATMENDRDYDRAVLESDRDNDYRNRTLEFNMDTDARDYARAVLESDRNHYENYVAQMLANGQMPSAEMLAAVGLSADDAQKLMAQIVQYYPYPMEPEKETTYTSLGDMPFDEANRRLTNVELGLDNLPASVLNPNMQGTVGDFKDQVAAFNETLPEDLRNRVTGANNISKILNSKTYNLTDDQKARIRQLMQ